MIIGDSDEEKEQFHCSKHTNYMYKLGIIRCTAAVHHDQQLLRHLRIPAWPQAASHRQ